MDKLLLVDSNQQESELLQKYLARAGFDIMAIGGIKGLSAKITAARPNLIVLSSVLNYESGFDACKRLKDSSVTDYIPVLLICDNEDALRAVESGADDYLTINDDAGTLISKVNTLLRIKRLSDQLKSQYVELEEKNRLLESQLKMARKVQRSFIQDYDFTHGDALFYSRYIPALDIGGDYYDIIKVDEDNVSILVGDVSGHGISSSLLVAMVHSMARNLAYRYTDPGKFLGNMNKWFFKTFEDSDTGMYVCMFCAVINIKKKVIRFSNAGHVLPIHYSKIENSAEELMSVGRPIGMTQGSFYENTSSRYENGDTLMFYTDGLSDNYSRSDDISSSQWLKYFLMETENMSLDNIAKTLFELSGLTPKDESDKFKMDDMSLILCRL